MDSLPKLHTFDLFDTLIARPLKRPVNVFDMIEMSRIIRYRSRFFRAIPFRYWRVLAERLARRLSRREDIVIHDIYRILGILLRNPAQVLRQELRLEAALLEPIPENVARLRQRLTEGERCCIVTDMYMPQPFLRRLVRRLIGTDIDIFASSRVGLTKRSGNLYTYLAGHHAVALSAIHHEGDNPHSDFLVPKELGMTATLLPMRGHKDGSSSFFENFVAPDLWDDVFARLGYSVVGPACIAFAMYLRDQLRVAGHCRVFFCARDTYLIKEAFDLLSPDADSRYLRVSRSAVYIPAFAVHGDYDRFFEGRLSAKEFFERLGVEVPAELEGLDPRQHRARFIDALERMDFRAQAMRERGVLEKFLMEQGFSGDIALVDLGWRGSLHRALADVMGEQASVSGYYFGTIVPSPRFKAYYFNNCHPLKRMASVFQSLPVFEFLFTEPVRSLLKISSRSGGFALEYVDDEPDSQLAQRERIAVGCRRFFSDFMRVQPCLNLTAQDLLRPLDKSLEANLLSIDRDMLDALRTVGHAEGFGGSMYASLLDDRKFTLAGYRNSYWRAAYVRYATGMRGWLARRFHGIVYSRLGVFLIYRRHEFLRALRAWTDGTRDLPGRGS